MGVTGIIDECLIVAKTVQPTPFRHGLREYKMKASGELMFTPEMNREKWKDK